MQAFQVSAFQIQACFPYTKYSSMGHMYYLNFVSSGTQCKPS